MAALSDVQEEARRCIARGWSIVPLEPRAKQCVHKDWLTRDYAASDVQDDQNLGIKSINGLVDVDCDCEEAVFFAVVFLPKTTAVYGRASRPRSHWLYHCADIREPLALKDLILKKMLVEIRVNHQSMAPPSVHPEGEIVAWNNPDPKAMVVDKALLVRGVQLVATGSLIARYYNAPGDRHDWGVAMAGTLRRLGINQAEADRLMERAGKWVKDDKVKDRLDAVRSTYARNENEPATGGKTLAELTGDKGSLRCTCQGGPATVHSGRSRSSRPGGL